MPRTILSCAGALLAFALSAPVYAENPPPLSAAAPFTLDRALALADANHPELAAAGEEIRARQAEVRQAATRPNPTLDLELENVAGNGEFSGADAAETTLMLTQAIELGDKRERRRQSAETAVALAQAEREIARAELAARVSKGFFAVLAAQERQRLADEQVALARRSLAAVAERIAAGQAPATEELRVRLVVTELELALGQTTQELAAARRELAILLGTGEAEIAVSGDLARLPQVPPLAELERELERSPRQRRQTTEVEQRDRELALEEARGVPDLEVGLGVRHVNDSDDAALVAGISIPLPLFDRNQGNIAAARHRQTQARAERSSTDLEQRAALTTAWRTLASARDLTEALRDEVLPAAEAAFAAVEYGYRAGKFPLFDVLDAQRTLIEVRQRHLAALADCHRAAAELTRLLGRPLDSPSPKEHFPS